MLRTLIHILATALALGGCATRPGAPEPKIMAVPQRWASHPPDSPIDTLAAKGSSSAEWWSTLADAQLNELVRSSLGANADVAVAAARLEQTRAAAEGARAARLPRLDAGTGALRERVPRSSSRDSDGTSVTIPAFRQSRFSVQVEARYELDLLGRLKLGQRAAEAELAASQSDVLAIRRWLAHEVVLAYTDIRIADDQSFDNKRSQALQQLIVQAEERKLAAGLSTRGAARQTKRDLAGLLDAEAVLRRDRDLALARLAVLLGKAPIEVQIAPTDRYFQRLVLSGAVSPELPASVIAARADVAAAWQRVEGAAINAEQTRLERYPELTLTGNAGFVSEAVRRWLKGDALAWVAQAALQAPVFDGGRVEARTNRAVAALHEQHELYRKTVLQALAGVENALSESMAAKTRLHLAEAEQDRRSTDLDAAHTALNAGSGSRPALLQSELALVEAVSATSLRRHKLLAAWAGAQMALGR